MLQFPLWAVGFLQEAGGDSGAAAGAAVGGGFGGIIGLAVAVLAIVGMWKVFSKAGRPGWAAIIPIYNLYVLLKVAGKPGWWLLLFLIPFVNLIMLIIVNINVAKAFGKSAFLWGFVMLTLLSAIGYIVLGFGSAQYQGSAKA